MKFLMIEGALLCNKNISAQGKVLISYLANLKKHGKSYYGGLDYLSDQLGIENYLLTKLINNYIGLKLMEYNSNGLTLCKNLEYFFTFNPKQLSYEKETRLEKDN